MAGDVYISYRLQLNSFLMSNSPTATEITNELRYSDSKNITNVNTIAEHHKRSVAYTEFVF